MLTRLTLAQPLALKSLALITPARRRASAVTGDLATNSSAVEFPAASGGNWGTITHMAVMTASSSGDMIVHSALTVAKAINDGDVFRIPTGDLDITLA